MNVHFDQVKKMFQFLQTKLITFLKFSFYCMNTLNRVVIFNIEVPITRGFPVELHYKAISEPAVFKKLISQLHKNTGEVVAKKPRILLKVTCLVVVLNKFTQKQHSLNTVEHIY